jgi:hypothetical protein
MKQSVTVGFTETHQRQTDITESLIENKLEIIQHRTENRIINSACCQHRLSAMRASYFFKLLEF